MIRPRKRRWPRLGSLYLWHRHIGVTAAILVLIMAVSGLLLNHTERLRLDQRFIGAAPLLDWYGIEAPRPAAAYRAGAHWVVQLGDRLYLDETPLAGRHGRLLGALQRPGLLVVAAADGLLLLTPEGDLVEKLGGAAGVPAGLAALGGNDHGETVVRGAHGLYRADADFSAWRRHDGAGMQWSQPAEPPPGLLRRLQARYRGGILPLERVLLDLHSGRILGEWGVWLMDAAAVLLLLLAGSGGFLWWQQHRKLREHRRPGRKPG